MKKFIIENVIDIKTGKTSETFGYRIGRICELETNYIELNVPLVIHYRQPNTYKYCMTSPITKIEISSYGYVITTNNRKYFFKNLDTTITKISLKMCA